MTDLKKIDVLELHNSDPKENLREIAWRKGLLNEHLKHLGWETSKNIFKDLWRQS